MFVRIKAFFAAIIMFFSVLFSGYGKYMTKDKIYLKQHYGEGERHGYVLALPKKFKGDTGLVICIHGGSWTVGDYTPYERYVLELCKEKQVAAAAINYDYLSETTDADDILDDITQALRAIKKQGDAYGLNINRVIITGASAGAHLAMLYAYKMKDVSPVKPVAVVSFCGPADLKHPDFYSEDMELAKSMGGPGKVYELISHLAGFDFTEENFDEAVPYLDACSPLTYVDGNTVPTIICHGEEDTVVPYENAVALDGKMTELGVEHVFVSFPDSGHACEDKASREKVFELADAYVDRFLK